MVGWVLYFSVAILTPLPLDLVWRLSLSSCYFFFWGSVLRCHLWRYRLMERELKVRRKGSKPLHFSHVGGWFFSYAALIGH
ncbi:hypothetical protein B9Z19DRAFT_444205 [Tuber borchii]|uniref:Uncharacterized protein n=1 Tax=Tuber borchii TaxID=42251 RepID=A0A2T6ZG21_TUBBO|nr:hypothetical protein B9Z19DRAFT_444205 [Tuber borchii]